MALGHGLQDAQKTMGVIVMALIAGGYGETHQVFDPATGDMQIPLWVKLAAAGAISLGTYSGGWRIMRTMGKGLCDIESPQGFAAETASTAAILASSHLGFALSTTHVCSGSILGSGLGRHTEVRWATAGKMVVAWLVTLPAAALVGALTSAIAGQGTWGVIVDLVLLAIMATLIVRQANHHKVDHRNVNDSTQVGVRRKAPAATGKAAA